MANEPFTYVPNTSKPASPKQGPQDAADKIHAGCNNTVKMLPNRVGGKPSADKK